MEKAPPLDVIIDTDIGTDIDDAYAVLLSLSSPELNVRGFTMVHADVEMRSRIALKILKLAGRTDIPVALGSRKPMDPDRPEYWAGHEGRGIDFSDIRELRPVKEPAAEFIARTASELPGELTLITIGPMTNAGILLRDFPKEAEKLRRVVSMGSTFEGCGDENAGKEHNISLDPEAVELVLRSGVPVDLVGLNVTLQTALTKAFAERIRWAGTPLADLMYHMTDDWFNVCNCQTTPMHDPLAVAVTFESGLVEMIPVRAEVSLEKPGWITYYEAEQDRHVRVCSSVNVTGFQRIFETRVLNRVS